MNARPTAKLGFMGKLCKPGCWKARGIRDRNTGLARIGDVGRQDAGIKLGRESN